MLKGPVITASGGPWFLPSSALNIIQHSDERRAGPRKCANTANRELGPPPVSTRGATGKWSNS